MEEETVWLEFLKQARGGGVGGGGLFQTDGQIKWQFTTSPQVTFRFRSEGRASLYLPVWHMTPVCPEKKATSLHHLCYIHTAAFISLPKSG